MSTSSAYCSAYVLFLQFSYLLYKQKHCFWAYKTSCYMHTDSKRRENKPSKNDLAKERGGSCLVVPQCIATSL